jgi:hypothetical protein
MSTRTGTGLLAFTIAVACFLAAGCVSTSVGDVGYRNGTFIVAVENPTGPAGAYIQVRVFQTNNLHQEEIGLFEAPVNLSPGTNRVSVPGQIGPGHYKVFVYVLQNGERKTAVIRDIVV